VAELPCWGLTHLFYGTIEQRGKACDVCATCAQRDPCLEGALGRREPDGVWGGVDFGRAAELRAERAHRRELAIA
jgi:hypothetical protein